MPCRRSSTRSSPRSGERWPRRGSGCRWRRWRTRPASAPPVRDFRAALAGPGPIQLIAEVKKASPSAQVIRADFDPIAIARTYQAHGAACLSVLTDAPYFQGHLSYLARIRASVAIPLLAQGLHHRRVSGGRGPTRRRRRDPADRRDPRRRDAGAPARPRARRWAWRPWSSSTTRPTCPGSSPPAPTWSGSTTATCTGSSPTWIRPSGSATRSRPTWSWSARAASAPGATSSGWRRPASAAILVGETLMRADDIGLAVERLLGLSPEPSGELGQVVPEA